MAVTRKNKVGKTIVVELTDEKAFGFHGAYEGHCFGCQRSSKPVRERAAHQWADDHARTCNVG